MANHMQKLEKKRVQLAIIPAIVFTAIIWLAFTVSASGVLDFSFSRLGIQPRELSGLKGILFSPFIHSSLSHIVSNTLPILILTWFLFYFYNKIAFQTFFYLWLLSGFFTWIIGRSSFHIGASGLVFALVFFLFFSGIFRKHIPLIAVSMIVVFLYGSTLWSIFPIAEIVDEQISWEAHLSGAISGSIIAVVFRKHGPQKPQVEWDDDEEENEAEVSNDIFMEEAQEE